MDITERPGCWFVIHEDELKQSLAEARDGATVESIMVRILSQCSRGNVTNDLPPTTMAS